MVIKTFYFTIDNRNCWTCVPSHYKEFDVPSLIVLPSGEEITAIVPSILGIVEDTLKNTEYKPFLLAGFESDQWEKEFTPWSASKLFRKADDFLGEAENTLNWVVKMFIPAIEDKFLDNRTTSNNSIMGYSLGGLFALWAFYESDIFQGCASCSGSLWYDNWMEYMESHSIRPESRIYLSLGKSEENTKNKRMSPVGDNTRNAITLFESDENVIESELDWQDGGHFKDVDKRLAKALLWLIKQR